MKNVKHFVEKQYEAFKNEEAYFAPRYFNTQKFHHEHKPTQCLFANDMQVVHRGNKKVAYSIHRNSHTFSSSQRRRVS